MLRQLISIVLVVTLTGCKSEPPPPPTFDPVTAAEAEAYGKKLAALLDVCDASAIAPLWNAEITARRAIADTKASDEIKDGMLALFTSERLWESQCQSLIVQGEVRNRFLGVRDVSGEPRPLIRMLSAAGLNYAELELGRFGSEVQAVDAIYYMTGERISRTFARLMGSAQNAIDDGTLANGDTMERVAARQRAGDNQGALELIAELPPALRADKSIMLLEVALSPVEEEATYLAAIERFEQAYPGDPALDLVAVDGFLLRKQYDRVHAALDRLEKRVPDPYLEVMRANAFLDAKEHDKALAAVKGAIEREPDLQDAWDSKAVVCLGLKDYPCAVDALKVMNQKFAVEITVELALQLENGAELVASDAWKSWQSK